MDRKGPNGRVTITEAAERVGVTPKTLLRWEKAGKTPKPKRDWRGWRVYEQEELSQLVAFHDRMCQG
ncbi:MAG TPA: MerR family DNA-binding transcriptional regulator [Planctomycetota bacterium]|nr:MerR family DNA-binding transcriptional regulator [Planctomycetota bacterium]HRR78805.1 MerR family DNA-binding transcriptional regulator [Planctomycetota bacterium]HRT92888.1 MerR family DNA-binding transcriptional regulator [Planctomycetota bacterium]